MHIKLSRTENITQKTFFNDAVTSALSVLPFLKVNAVRFHPATLPDILPFFADYQLFLSFFKASDFRAVCSPSLQKLYRQVNPCACHPFHHGVL